MLKKILQNSFIYILANLFTKGIGLLLLPFYIRLLTKSEYGYLDYVTALSGFVTIIIGLEVTQGLFRYLPEASGDKKIRNQYINSVLSFCALGYLLFGACIFLFEQELALWVFDDVSQTRLVKIVGIYLIASSFQNFITLILLSNQAAKHVAIVSFLGALLCGVVSISFLKFTELGLGGFFIGNIIGILISSGIGVAFIKPDITIRPNLKVLKKLLSFSLPLVPSSIGVMVMTFIDRVMLKEMMGIEMVASYGVAVKIATLVLLVTVGFQHTLSPLIYSRYKEPDTPSLIANLFHMYIFATGIFIVLFYFVADDVIYLIADESYLDASEPLNILVLANITASFYMFFPGLSLVAKTAIIAMINIAAGLLNTGLNFIFIQEFEVLGAAYASLLSITFSAFFTYYLSQRYYAIPIRRSGVVLYYIVILSLIGFQF
jgi:O-antigen/teichoic acid export membrane protein